MPKAWRYHPVSSTCTRNAQAFRDPALTPSSLFGVTTMLAGNCGLTIAPLNGNPAHAEYFMRMLARVEGMPLESLREGLPLDWHSFDDLLNRHKGRLRVRGSMASPSTAADTAGDFAGMAMLLFI